VWFKMSGPNPGNQMVALAAKGDSSWRIQCTEAGRMRFDTCNANVPFNKAGYWQCLDGTTNVYDNRWHCCAVVYEPRAGMATKSLYVDGHLEATEEVPLARLKNDRIAWLGANDQFPNREPLGSIDEVAFFSRVLSVEEVAAMFRAGSP
jgi:hypothetical protein